jgi:hypothetical protein
VHDFDPIISSKSMTNELAEVAHLPGEGGLETRPYLSRDTGLIDVS